MALQEGLVLTAATSYEISLSEDIIDGKELNHNKALASSLISTATFGFAKYGIDKATKNVRGGFWNRGYTDPFGKYHTGNTNATRKWFERNPSTHVGQVGDRITDGVQLGNSFVIDYFFPGKSETSTSQVVVGNTVKISEEEFENNKEQYD